MGRKGKGRQKVEMVKMQNGSNLQVTFSKRRVGLFKKASELCTLCRAEVMIIVFSPGKKVFSFGHPSVEGLADRFLCGTPPPPPVSSTTQLVDAHRNADTRELNMHLTTLMNQLEIEKKRGENVNRLRKEGRSQNWWESLPEELNLPQLQQVKVSLQKLRKNAEAEAEKLVRMHNSNPPPPMPPHFFDTSASSSSGSRGGAFYPFEMGQANHQGYYLAPACRHGFFP